MLRIVVVGGGTAGWMAAAALSSVLPRGKVAVRLIESEAIGIVGVGEATLPHIRAFNETIGVDERAFMLACFATYKLGIEFVSWGALGERYIHPFGVFGRELSGIPFHQLAIAHGADDDFGAYSLPVVMCREGRFARPEGDPRSVASTFGYAYQFDATKYAPFLRRHAQERGVRRTEGIVEVVERHSESGDIAALRLSGGERIEGDFFIDCTGFRGLLIEETLQAGYERWDHWLPCDRAVAAPCEASERIVPYTRAMARDAGWQWRIPLQSRIGNGYVYSSSFTTDDQAEKLLRQNVEGSLLAEPKRLRFTTGRRQKFWSHNCVAVGLSGGFLEPLESTSIHLIQVAITNFVELFPIEGLGYAEERDAYNAMMVREFERVRDFLILHYHVTRRDDTEFWNYVRTMKVPDSLSEKMALFESSGRVARYSQGLFLEPSWLAVYLGQGMRPRRTDVRAEARDPDKTREWLARLRTEVLEAARSMPSHEEALAALAPAIEAAE
ncbi:MAG: tryptophan halogenase family protein [Parvularcula sp.]|jgi:tryptophan halogenase|nr:tryptophan halogenase family protein [Parvularcula sp.]